MKMVVMVAATLCMAAPASAQSMAEVTERINRIASGEYARQVEAERARTPTVNWSAAQIRAAGRGAVLAELRDPASAEFRNVRRIQHDNGSTMFCGEVNARNGYGGLAGFRRFEAGVTNRGRASAQVDSSETLTGSYFDAAWNQFCGRITGTPVQF
ncbi:MAG: hypothetical protein K5831_04520 [Brevundimonas sp.]|uniref:hypothetical protein n=1 Tax=Brevundimonas sp. TaxID=1871086 RepID=UPI002582F6D5|nr:hypothetical protein [Brevundimonas sp.]MCV0414130.1 hypothetical protein [Brevundimonas sp.]